MYKRYAFLAACVIMLVAGVVMLIRDWKNPDSRLVFAIVALLGLGGTIFWGADVIWWLTNPDAVSSASLWGLD